MDNGIYFTWSADGSSVNDVCKLIKELDDCAIRKGFKENSLLSTTRLPIIQFRNPEIDLSHSNLNHSYKKFYQDLHDFDVLLCGETEFGEKLIFFKKFSDDLAGFEITTTEDTAQDISPEMLRALWRLVLSMGSFTKGSNGKEIDNLAFVYKHLRLDAFTNAKDWTSHLYIKSKKMKNPRSSNNTVKFILKNGMKVSWDDFFSPLDLRLLLNHFKSALLIGEFFQNVETVFSFPLYYNNKPLINLDEDLTDQNDLLSFAKDVRSFESSLHKEI